MPASALLSPSGAPQRYDNVELTHQRRVTAGVVTAHDTEMKDPWFLATSRPDSAADIVALYGRRFSIEETFRDTKDPHFGLGLSQTHIGTPVRRDRLLMLFALAHALLTFLGRAGETLGLDRQLRVNTAKRRTHSLFRQGREYARGLFAKYAPQLRRIFLELLETHGHTDEVYAWI